MRGIFVGVVLFCAAILCAAQGFNAGSAAQDIVAGPFGVPLMVMADGGRMSYPIEVYTGKYLRVFVPDITSPGWVGWHAAEFRTNGTYYTNVYLYHSDTRATESELIFVDTRAKFVQVSGFM